MDYEKKYKESLAKARHYYLTGKGEPVDFIKMIFPELKESEDEKMANIIREALANVTSENTLGKYGLSHSDVSDWLEKQGEHANFINKIQIGDKVTRNEDGVLVNLSQLNRVAKKDEKQGEQKPADKVKPKFKVGDWIVTNKNHIWYVNENPETTSYLYRLINQYGKVEVAEFEVVDNVARLWTIQDAKDGDVLCCESGWTCIFRALDNHTNTFSSYCFMDSDKWFCNTGCTCHTLDEQFIRAYNFKLHPATKEQRDTLIKAMADAGYTFDFKKKELKKIEQKPAWSEEDETTKNNISHIIRQYDKISKRENKPCWYIGDCLLWIQNIKDKVQPKQEWSKEDDYYYGIIQYILNDECVGKTDKENAINWLKSLSPQNRWKPSDEQMKALEHFVRSVGESGYASPYDNNTKLLYSLLSDLKKLIKG